MKEEKKERQKISKAREKELIDTHTIHQPACSLRRVASEQRDAFELCNAQLES